MKTLSLYGVRKDDTHERADAGLLGFARTCHIQHGNAMSAEKGVKLSRCLVGLGVHCQMK